MSLIYIMLNFLNNKCKIDYIFKNHFIRHSANIIAHFFASYDFCIIIWEFEAVMVYIETIFRRYWIVDTEMH